MLQTLKFFFTRVYTITSIVLFALSYGAIQAYAVYYPTDNITNPTCAPGDSGCYVSLLPDQTSNSGSLLFTNGTNPSWTSSSALSWDSVNGRLGVGTSTPAQALDVNGSIRFTGSFYASSNGAKSFFIDRYSTNSFSDELVVRKSRGTESAPLPVVSGDEMGGLEFYGYDGAGFRPASMIRGYVDGVVGVGNIPGRLSFFVNSGSQSNYGSEVMTIKSNGNIGVGTTTPASRFHIGVSPTASANYGTLSLGGGAFDGTTSGYFGTASSSNTNGTSLAINEASGYIGDLINLQKAGVSAFKVDALGNTTITNIDDSTSNPGFIVNSLRAGALSGRFNSFNSQDTGINTSNIGFFSQYKKITNSTNGSAVAFQLYSDAGNNAENITVATQYNMQLYTRNRTTNAVTNQYGLFLANSNISTGSVVNSYGIYISGMPTVTGTSYALYNNTTAPSYFGGNIGIGTVTPSAPLDIATSAGNSTFGAFQSSFVSTYTGGSTQIANKMVVQVPTSAVSSAYIAISGQAQTGGSSTTISGLTGISGSAFIQSAGSITSAYAGIFGTTNSSTATITNAFGISTSVTNTGTMTNTYGIYVGDVSSGTQTNTPFSIYSSDASSRNYFAGNVGIGTTSPIAKLDVRGDALFAGGTRVTKTVTSSDSSAEFENGISIFKGTNNVGWVLNSDTSNNFGLYNWNGAGYVLRINSSGFVGVSQASPSYKLHVGDGTTVGIIARFQNSTGTCDINPTTTSLSCSSDRTLKTNITNLNNTILNQITSLQPVTYTWINDNTNQQQTGFIAQDVEQIFPSLVSTDPNTNLKSLNYIGLIPYAIEGIRELDIKVNQQASLDTEIVGSFGYLAKEFLGNVNNTIDTIFAKKVKTEELCIKDTCVTEEQLKALLNNVNSVQIQQPEQLQPNILENDPIAEEIEPEIPVSNLEIVAE